MRSESPPSPGAVATLFNVFERLILLALSLAVGLLNLLIGLTVAAHMGVIPKAAADRVLHVTAEATAFVSRVLGPSHDAAHKHKAKH